MNVQVIDKVAFLINQLENLVQTVAVYGEDYKEVCF